MFPSIKIWMPRDMIQSEISKVLLISIGGVKNLLNLSNEICRNLQCLLWLDCIQTIVQTSEMLLSGFLTTQYLCTISRVPPRSLYGNQGRGSGTSGSTQVELFIHNFILHRFLSDISIIFMVYTPQAKFQHDIGGQILALQFFIHPMLCLKLEIQSCVPCMQRSLGGCWLTLLKCNWQRLNSQFKYDAGSMQNCMLVLPSNVISESGLKFCSMSKETFHMNLTFQFLCHQ